MFTSLFEDKYDNLVKRQYQSLTYYVNNTCAKLAPDSILNKQIKEIMRYTGGGHRTSPLTTPNSKNTHVNDNTRTNIKANIPLKSIHLL